MVTRRRDAAQSRFTNTDARGSGVVSGYQQVSSNIDAAFLRRNLASYEKYGLPQDLDRLAAMTDSQRESAAAKAVIAKWKATQGGTTPPPSGGTKPPPSGGGTPKPPPSGGGGGKPKTPKPGPQKPKPQKPQKPKPKPQKPKDPTKPPPPNPGGKPKPKPPTGPPPPNPGGKPKPPKKPKPDPIIKKPPPGGGPVIS